jgi:hypothetical protein
MTRTARVFLWLGIAGAAVAVIAWRRRARPSANQSVAQKLLPQIATLGPTASAGAWNQTQDDAIVVSKDGTETYLTSSQRGTVDTLVLDGPGEAPATRAPNLLGGFDPLVTPIATESEFT